MGNYLNPLVEKIRTKYPGAYDDMDDATLTKKVLTKYPQYSDLAAPAMPDPVRNKLNPKLPNINNLIMQAPEESGLETGPLISPHPEENVRTKSFSKDGAAALGDPVMNRTRDREVNTGFELFRKMIPGLYHAVADPASNPEETAIEQHGGRISLAAHRAIVQPIKTAIDAYSSGSVSPDDALSVAPEAMGTAAGSVVGSKMIEAAPAALKTSAPFAKALAKPIAKSVWDIADSADITKPGQVITKAGPKVIENFKGVGSDLQDAYHATQPPKPRPEPAWKTQNTEGEPVPSILDREPTQVGPGRQNFPSKTPKPARVPMWKKLQQVAKPADPLPAEETNGTPGPTSVPNVSDPAMADVETAQRGRINELDAKYPVEPGSAVTQPDPFAQPKAAPKKPFSKLSDPDAAESRSVQDQIRNYAGPEDPSEDAVGAIHRRLFSEGASARSPKGDAIAEANGEEPDSGPVKYTANKPAGIETAPMAEKLSLLEKFQQQVRTGKISPEGMTMMQKLQTMLDAAKKKNEGRF